MKKLPLVAAGAVALPIAVLVACATDNGDNIHGQQFGPPPTRPDGAIDGSAEEGGLLPDPDGGGGEGGEAGPPCTTPGTIAVLAGNDTSLTGSVQINGGAWTGATIANAASKDLPALVPFGTGFLGVTHGLSDGLQSVTFSTSWSAPQTIGVPNLKFAPSLALVGTKPHVVYVAGAGDDVLYFHGIHDGAAWNAADDPVGTPPGDPQSFGDSTAALAGSATELAFAQVGFDNAGVYSRTWNGSWSTNYEGPDGIPGIDGAGADKLAAPAFVAVDGKFDLVLVYANESTKKVQWTARDSVSKTFTAPALVNASLTTYASTDKPISLVRLGQFTVLMTFMGTDGKGYYVSGTLGATSITWSSPAAVAAGGVTVDSTPRAAKGVCGDDGVIVFASAGQVKAVRLRGSTLTPPEAVAGASGSRVSVASR